MALNLDLIGKKLDSVSFTYNEDAAILYALGIGAGVDELDFVYEKNLKVYPTFAVVPCMPAMVPVFSALKLNMFKVLHGEQKIVLHKPIPVKGKLTTTAVCTSVYDKGDNGAVVNLNFETHGENGELLFENQIVLVDRSAGNFGGDRGPKTEKILPPEGKAPDFQDTFETFANQAALYRLSGDKNPLHIDPDFARKGGFDRPILHGLCSLGIAGKAIVHAACDGDPDRLKSLAVRFMNPVCPGDTLITEGWKVDSTAYIIQTKTAEGKIILANAMAELN